MPAVPSHIDPNPANFLRGADGRLLLIDWEFSAMCEPVWDLAGIAIEGRLDPAAEDLLLIAYERGGTAIPRLRYRRLKAALHLVAASWAKAELASDPHRPEIEAVMEEIARPFWRWNLHPATSDLILPARAPKLLFPIVDARSQALGALAHVAEPNGDWFGIPVGRGNFPGVSVTFSTTTRRVS